MDRLGGLRFSRKDLLSGLVFTGLGLFFAIGALEYDIGDPRRMGPGWFPLVLGSLLTLMGGIIVVKAFLAPEGEPIGTVPWRAIIVISGAILFFGLTVRGLGLAPALLGTTFLSGLASPKVNVPLALAVAVGLTILSILIFVVGLQLRLSLIGPWLGGN